jgi:hypothetical protein
MATTMMFFRTLGVRESMRKESFSPVRWATSIYGHKQDQNNFYREKVGPEELENLLPLPPPDIECRLHFRPKSLVRRAHTRVQANYGRA